MVKLFCFISFMLEFLCIELFYICILMFWFFFMFLIVVRINYIVIILRLNSVLNIVFLFYIIFCCMDNLVDIYVLFVML